MLNKINLQSFDPLDEQLKKLGIDLIAPHKANRKKAQTQDGKKLRRYKDAGKSNVFLRGCKTFG